MLTNKPRTSCDGVSFIATVPESGNGWRLMPRDAEGRADAGAIAASQAATLSVCDADPPTNAHPDRPWVMRSRFQIHQGAHAWYFHLDRDVTAAMRAGDAVHIAGTKHCGVGVAVFRDRQLVVAMGAVSAVLTSGDITASVAPELWEEAVSRVPTMLGMARDPRKDLRHEQPIVIRMAGHRILGFGCNETTHGMHVFVKHGYRPRDAKDECVALARRGLCSAVSATTSAFLLSVDGLREASDTRNPTMTSYPGKPR